MVYGIIAPFVYRQLFRTSRDCQSQRPFPAVGVVPHRNGFTEVARLTGLERDLYYALLAAAERLLRVRGFRTLAVRRGREDNGGGGLSLNVETHPGGRAQFHIPEIVFRTIGHEPRNVGFRCIDPKSGKQ